MPIPKPKDDTWIDRVVIACGVLVAIAILYGLSQTVQPFLSDRGAPKGAMPACDNCLTLKDTNTSIVMAVGEERELILPKTYFNQDGFTVLSSAEGGVGHRFDNSRNTPDYWAVIIQGLKPGLADVIVRSNIQTVSDFHLSLTIQ